MIVTENGVKREYIVRLTALHRDIQKPKPEEYFYDDDEGTICLSPEVITTITFDILQKIE